jgi:hypothetical protein
MSASAAAHNFGTARQLLDLSHILLIAAVGTQLEGGSPI